MTDQEKTRAKVDDLIDKCFRDNPRHTWYDAAREVAVDLYLKANGASGDRKGR